MRRGPPTPKPTGPGESGRAGFEAETRCEPHRGRPGDRAVWVESRAEADYTSSWRMVRRSRSSMFFGSISSAMNAGTVRPIR